MNPARRHPCLSRQRQSGVAAMLILFVIAVVAISLLVNALKSSSSQTERDKITTAALGQAKAALIGFAASVNLYPPPSGCTSPTTCPRPGDLPCPDSHPSGSLLEGTSSTPCPAPALGRLPWRTLGLPDLRDGSGERLWYAVSINYKNIPRAFPLNSDTLGTISVRDPNGTTIADFTAGTGAAAIVISPGTALTRQDGVAQDRSPAGFNNPINYLDTTSAEDNRNFVDKSSNGFIQGPIKNAGNSIILNDTLIILSRDDVMRVVEKRVAAEVTNALLPLLGSLPNPAAFNDNLCLGSGTLSNCNSSAGTRGRIPANPLPPWPFDAAFLNGNASGNWFQQNAWREVIYYTTGSLILQNPPSTSISPLNVLIIMAGPALGTQNRSTSNKLLEANYLEEENSTPLNDTYTLRPVIAATPFNDKVRCLPASPPHC